MGKTSTRFPPRRSCGSMQRSRRRFRTRCAGDCSISPVRARLWTASSLSPQAGSGPRSGTGPTPSSGWLCLSVKRLRNLGNADLRAQPTVQEFAASGVNGCKEKRNCPGKAVRRIPTDGLRPVFRRRSGASRPCRSPRRQDPSHAFINSRLTRNITLCQSLGDGWRNRRIVGYHGLSSRS